jgi:hypothetical protein
VLHDLEERLIQNPLTGAVVLWEFTRKYETHRNTAQGATLLLLMPVLPIVFQRGPAEKLRGMHFDSGLAKFLEEAPTVRADLQRRVAEFSSFTLSSINVACASGLLRRMPLVTTPTFVTRLPNLPAQVVAKGTPATLSLAARRLGAFFRDETVFQMETKLGIVL